MVRYIVLLKTNINKYWINSHIKINYERKVGQLSLFYNTEFKRLYCFNSNSRYDYRDIRIVSPNRVILYFLF